MRVYIAGPYTRGDVALNVRNAIEVANVIMNAGHCPFVPHLTHFWHLVCPRPYEEWLKLDMEWLSSCDCVIRLPGISLGADRELELAKIFDLPIYHSAQEFLASFEDEDVVGGRT